MVDYETPLKILYSVAVLLCLSFFVESVIYLVNKSIIKNWKPDITKMHYSIKTNVENCVLQFSYNEDSKIYEVEYKELLTGKSILKRIINYEQYIELAQKKTISIEISLLRIYIITPNKHVMYREFTRTEQDEKYRAFSKYDINFNLLRICAEYFKGNCPIKGQGGKNRTDIKFVEGLPRVKDYPS